MEDSGRGDERGRQRTKNVPSITGAEQILASPFRMRHQPKHISTAVADARDIVPRAVGIGAVCDISRLVAITKNNPVFALKLVESLIVTDIVSLGMRDWKPEYGSTFHFIGEWSIGSFHANKNVFTNEVQVPVADQSSGKQSGFTKNLEPVANAQDESAAFGKLLNRIHHRREAGECASAQVIAVRKPARNNQSVIAGETGIPVPDEVHGLAHVFRDHVVGIVIAIRAGKNYNSKLQASISTR